MGVGGLDGGGPVDMLATWCVRKLRGDARPSPYRVLSVAPVRMSRRSTCSRSGKTRKPDRTRTGRNPTLIAFSQAHSEVSPGRTRNAKYSTGYM